MRHRYPIGAFVTLRDPDDQGRRSDGQPFTCTVLEHLASDSRQPMYLLNEGIVYADCYQVIACEDELIDTSERRWKDGA